MESYVKRELRSQLVKLESTFKSKKHNARAVKAYENAKLALHKRFEDIDRVQSMPKGFSFTVQTIYVAGKWRMHKCTFSYYDTIEKETITRTENYKNIRKAPVERLIKMLNETPALNKLFLRYKYANVKAKVLKPYVNFSNLPQIYNTLSVDELRVLMSLIGYKKFSIILDTFVFEME